MWQYILVASLIAIAVVYLGRVLWRSTKGCGGGCHCANGKQDAGATVKQVTLIPEEQLKIRRKV